VNDTALAANHCFVCGRDNPHGMQIRFRIEGDLCRGEFVPPVKGQYFDNVSPVNGEAFCQEVKMRSHVELEVVPEEEEARLAFKSVKRHFNLEGEKTAIVDVGGGSIEVILAAGTVSTVLPRTVVAGT